MTFELNEAEWALLEHLPVQELVALAADLDVVIPGEIDRRSLASHCIPLMLTRACAEGLPLSKYDQADLEALSPEGLAALAAVQGVRGTPSVRSVLKAGQKAYRTLEKQRRGPSPFAAMVPILMGPLVRHAVEIGVHRGVRP